MKKFEQLKKLYDTMEKCGYNNTVDFFRDWDILRKKLEFLE